jgi:CRISPR-associated protein Cst2
MRAKFMELAFLTKIEKTNINASGTEGNVTTLKKTEEVDGTQRIFISGASVKYSVKEYLRGSWELSRVEPKIERQRGKAKEGEETEETGRQVTTACEPDKYIDDDLFGFMDTSVRPPKKRVAPVKTNGLISLFPYKGDINRGVRFDPTGQEQHSLYDIEITTNIFRSNWAIELDRIGEYEGSNPQAGKKASVKSIEDAEKEKRAKALLESLFNLWSKVKQTNFLSKLTPEVMTIVLRDDKTMTIADKLKVDENMRLNISALKEALSYHKTRVKEAYLGYFPSFITNQAEVDSLQAYEGKLKISSLSELKDMILGDDFKLYT